ncbi:pirin family protein [Rubrivivax sp. RP6-9]|uniref:pirin family protein n=1 Tax=Rubrivivax sp. RP6-9 TaxID=3415750 RepID=UPI003CC5B504
MSTASFEVRRDADRGRFTNDWLDARFSFSFGAWHDPAWQRFGPLLAINEDRVQPARGFPMHPHADLEILMLPRSGRIEHRDDFGGHAVIAPGELHVMRAGWGIRHSQMNPSSLEVDHHFQIWLAPRTSQLTPHVQTLRLTPPGRGAWIVLASGLGAGGAAIDVDATVAWGSAGAGDALRLPARAGARRYLHLMSGSLAVQGHRLQAGDALVQRDAAGPLTLEAVTAADVLCFDLPVTP